MGTIKLGNLEVKAGMKEKGALGTIKLADGSRVSIPLVIARGEKEGHNLVVCTGVHGTEVCGIYALQRVFQELDTSSLTGSLIGIPGANPITVTNGFYVTQFDNDNLSSAFSYPDPEGGMTARMAAYIWKALDIADYVIDIHANPFPSIPFVLTNMSACKDEHCENELKKMTEAFGITRINWNRPVRNMRDVCSFRGVPSITPELSGNLYYWDDVAEVGSRGIRNVMRAIGMLEGEMEKQEDVKIIPSDLGELEYVGRIRCHEAGLMRVVVGPGEKALKGDTVIEIYSFLGELLEEVKMPCTGYCWSYTGGMHSSSAITEGTPLAYVFKHVDD